MDITKVREICYTKAREFGYNLYCPVLENKRFSKTLGRVTWDEEGELEKIEFSTLLLTSATDEAIMNTILHELAHAFVYLETGEIHGHDAEFRSMCHRLGTIDDRAHSKSFTLKDGIEQPQTLYKYSIYCPKCGKLIGHRSRKCKIITNPEQYFSKCCYATPSIVQNY